MRHMWSLLAGIVAAPLAWLLLATGQYRSQDLVAGWDESGRFDTVDLIGPVLFLVAAGVVLGLVGTLRWSPVGPLVAGGLLAVPTVFMFINPFRTLDAFSYDQQRRILNQDLQLWLPVENGTLLVLGALLVMAVFSTQRWRRWPAGAGLTAAPVAAAPVATEADEIPASDAATDEQPTATSDGDSAADTDAAADTDEKETADESVKDDEDAEDADDGTRTPIKGNSS